MLKTVMGGVATGVVVAGVAVALPAAASAAEPGGAPIAPAAYANPLDPTVDLPCTQPLLHKRADRAGNNGHEQHADRLDNRADRRADILNCEHPG
jgi:hypothetical protein